MQFYEISTDVLIVVLQYLEPNDLASLSQTSSYMQYLVSELRLNHAAKV